MTKSKCISVRKNNEFIHIEYFLRGMLDVIDPDQEMELLEPDVDNAIIGRLAKDKLSMSRDISLQEFQQLFHSNRCDEKTKKEEKQLKEKFGYKNKKEIYQHMFFLSINLYDKYYEIIPWHTDGLNSSTGMGKDNKQIYLTDISDEELGQKIKEAFKLCTSKYT